MDTRRIGGLEISRLGLGCMGMSEFYGPTDWDESTRVIHAALDAGVTLLDTANMYGHGHNEVLVGRAIAGRRDEARVATKFGIDRSYGTQAFLGDPRYVRASCEASLTRLGIETIDIYYLHRPPTDVPIEETVGAMAELITAGKVRALGLSEVTAEMLDVASDIAPIAAVQSEYSLWTRNVEKLVPTMRKHGLALVCYSPLGRGFFAGQTAPERWAADDFRRTNARFAPEALRTNVGLYREVERIAGEIGATPAQVSLAWLLQRPDALGLPVVPIPGTKRVARLAENVAATEVRLSLEQIGVLDGLVTGVVGARYGVRAPKL